MRRKKGPSRTEEWEEALSGTLTSEKVEYLKRGKLGKTDYNKLVKRIGDCVTDNINAALAVFEEGSEDLIENLFRLERLSDTVQKVYFFKNLAFIKKSDAEKLSLCISEAVEDFVRRVEELIDFENADLTYHISELKRLAA